MQKKIFVCSNVDVKIANDTSSNNEKKNEPKRKILWTFFFKGFIATSEFYRIPSDSLVTREWSRDQEITEILNGSKKVEQLNVKKNMLQKHQIKHLG